MYFQHLKASWFWVDNYSVPSQAAVTKEQELPKWSKMHRSLLLSNHTIMNPVTAFWGIEVKDRKREKKKKSKGRKKELWTFCSSQLPRKWKHQACFKWRMPSHSTTVPGAVATGQIPETRISQSTQTQSLPRCELSLMAAHIRSRENKKNGRNGWMNFIQDLTYDVSIMNMT